MGDRLRKYEIIRPLGSGGMSKVYLAKDHKGKLYAIKEMAEFASSVQKEVAVRTFIKEMKILSSLNHPGLPEFHEKFGCRRRLYIAMEYMEGDTLEDIIKSSSTPLSEERVLFWSIQLCEILFYLHTLSPEPVIYRDLKPSNVIIDGKGEVRLVDFGIARYYDPQKNRDTINLGTPGYAAPEQCGLEGRSTPETDIYALGVIMHQLLTRHEPSAESFVFPPIRKLNPGVPEQLERIINRAISLNPEDRYFSADIMKEELLGYYREKFGNFTSSYSNCSAIEDEMGKHEAGVNYILIPLAIFLFLLAIYFIMLIGDSMNTPF